MPALFIDSYVVLYKMLKMLQLNVCLYYSVDAPQQTQVNRSRNKCRLRVASCALQVARRVNAACIIY
jgi:hypothetical protein